MKKNVAGQFIGAQMITAADGTAFTGTVTARYTGDNGTQTVGSIGSGVCTHKGNGYHSYAPAQSETNFDHIAWTFTGTGAIPHTAQVYTNFPQTGDNFARLGAPAGASVSADIASVKSDTDPLPADPADASDIASSFATVNSAIAAIQTDVDDLQINLALVPTANANADALLKRDWTAVSGEAVYSVLNALRFLRNVWNIVAGVLSVKKEDGTTEAWQRDVTTDAAAEPVVGVTD